MSDVLLVCRKEFRGFFATPAAYLFLGAFLAAALFAFFWLETFFARNIADVRPLFRWLPVLLIFLVAALTMRSWSEERRSGTLESLLTAPVRPLDLVLGKFAAAMGLVALALALTLPLPVTVALLGPLDWGPVAGGYLATLFLAGAYAAIGVYMSARTDNPIVALILTSLVCGLFYLVGSPTLTNLFGHRAGGFMALLGTGSRFASISRGVLDLRDLYYYVSIMGVFLTLTLYSLERLRWAGNPSTGRHRLWAWAAALAVANFIAGNLWLAPIGWVRADISQGRIYSLSEATRRQLAQLGEPLVIRGYFSAKTHPMLAPLAPQIKDLLEEYAVASGGRAQVEIVDPTLDRAREEEAAVKYGVKPTPFQTASRYQTALVSSYFDVVVSYGDQYEVLGYRDLVEVKTRGDNSPEVVLKNPEYAVTRAIRKAEAAYRAGGNPFDSLAGPVRFHGYMTPMAEMPEHFKAYVQDLVSILDELEKQSGGKFSTDFQDPAAEGGRLGEELRQRYGIGPRMASIGDPKPVWFSMVMESGGRAVAIPPPDGPGKEALRRSLTAALRHLAPGSLKTVAVLGAQDPAPQGPGQPPGQPPAQAEGRSYKLLARALAENVRLVHADLKNGAVPGEADVLLVLAPNQLEYAQRFAIDQFLMRGGSVVLAASPFAVQIGQGLLARKISSGLEDWLAGYGLAVEDSLVLDPQNTPLPVPTERVIGGAPVREMRMVPYPHFPDLRGAQLSPDSPVTSSLGQLTMCWASPIRADQAAGKGRTFTRLLESSPQSWTSQRLDLVPDFKTYPATGYAVSGERGPRLMGVALEGRFESSFRDQSAAQGLAPGQEGGTEARKGQDGQDVQDTPAVTGVIGHSPESARLVLVASSAFASDSALTLASQGVGTFYTKPIEFLQNAIDWSLEDPALMSLRGRAQLSRTLPQLPEGEQRLWEYANYALALAGLGGVWLWRLGVARADKRRYQRILGEVAS